MERAASGKAQQPPLPGDVVEVRRDSSGQPQQPPAAEGPVEVRRTDPAARLAATQEGNVTRAQLRAAGLSPDQVDYRIAKQRLHRVHRGVFLVGHQVPPDRAAERAAVLALGKKAYISHGSALEQYGIVPPAPGGPIHVTLVGCCRRSRDDIRVHRTTRIAAEDVGTIDGLPITSPARALLDYAEYATPSQLRRAVNEAHVQRLATPDEIRALMKRTPGRRGAALLTATLDSHDGADTGHDGGELLLAALLRRSRLPRPEANVRRHGHELDFVYEDQKVVIECDSRRFHGTPSAVDRDRRKDAHLRSHNYEVLRYSYDQIADEPEAVLAEIAATLATRARRAA